jgi:hypothetical protein
MLAEVSLLNAKGFSQRERSLNRKRASGTSTATRAGIELQGKSWWDIRGSGGRRGPNLLGGTKAHAPGSQSGGAAEIQMHELSFLEGEASIDL